MRKASVLVFIGLAGLLAAAYQPPAGKRGEPEALTQSRVLTESDCGKTFIGMADGITVTLPPTASLSHGCRIKVANSKADGTADLSVAVGAGGHRIIGSLIGGAVLAKVSFFNLTGITNPQATQTRGDHVVLEWLRPDPTMAGWHLDHGSGTWLGL